MFLEMQMTSLAQADVMSSVFEIGAKTVLARVQRPAMNRWRDMLLQRVPGTIADSP